MPTKSYDNFTEKIRYFFNEIAITLFWHTLLKIHSIKIVQNLILHLLGVKLIRLHPQDRRYPPGLGPPRKPKILQLQNLF